MPLSQVSFFYSGSDWKQQVSHMMLIYARPAVIHKVSHYIFFETGKNHIQWVYKLLCV